MERREKKEIGGKSGGEGMGCDRELIKYRNMEIWFGSYNIHIHIQPFPIPHLHPLPQPIPYPSPLTSTQTSSYTYTSTAVIFHLISSSAVFSSLPLPDPLSQPPPLPTLPTTHHPPHPPTQHTFHPHRRILPLLGLHSRTTSTSLVGGDAVHHAGDMFAAAPPCGAFFLGG